jgi:hypothetical protein
MSETSQTRALRNYRKRLNQQGMARFEVLGLATDRELIRSMARRLADNGPEAHELRDLVHKKVVAEPRKKGGILAALLRSPLVGADLDFSRPKVDMRRIDL